VVATAAAGTGLAREIEGCGTVVPPGDAGALAEAITDLLDDEAKQRAYAVAARERAEAVWAKGAVLSRFVRALELAGARAKPREISAQVRPVSRDGGEGRG
jgi:colanic acid biosynthesis glycosyl transferase WcaI